MYTILADGSEYNRIYFKYCKKINDVSTLYNDVSTLVDIETNLLRDIKKKSIDDLYKVFCPGKINHDDLYVACENMIDINKLNMPYKIW